MATELLIRVRINIWTEAVSSPRLGVYNIRYLTRIERRLSGSDPAGAGQQHRGQPRLPRMAARTSGPPAAYRTPAAPGPAPRLPPGAAQRCTRPSRRVAMRSPRCRSAAVRAGATAPSPALSPAPGASPPQPRYRRARSRSPRIPPCREMDAPPASGNGCASRCGAHMASLVPTGQPQSPERAPYR